MTTLMDFCRGLLSEPIPKHECVLMGDLFNRTLTAQRGWYLKVAYQGFARRPLSNMIDQPLSSDLSLCRSTVGAVVTSVLWVRATVTSKWSQRLRVWKSNMTTELRQSVLQLGKPDLRECLHRSPLFLLMLCAVCFSPVTLLLLSIAFSC